MASCRLHAILVSFPRQMSPRSWGFRFSVRTKRRASYKTRADSAVSCPSMDSIVRGPAAMRRAVIVEDFLEFESHHSSADPFTVDGKLQAVSYGDMFLQFPSRQALDAAIADKTKWLEIKLSMDDNAFDYSRKKI